MEIIEVISLIIAFIFALISTYLFLKQKKSSVEIRDRELIQKQRLYQISVLKEIQDRIGYSLDVEKIIDVITGSLKHLLPYSTASSFVIKPTKIVFKAYVEESVNSIFIAQVKKSMLASLQALVANLPGEIDEVTTGVPLDNTKTAKVSSFFNIPLVVGNSVVGLINISSSEKNLYKEDEVTILYQIVAQASNALTKLQDVLSTEKGKLTSMISSLADGVFMVDINQNLLIINNAAKSFFNIYSKSPNLTDILTSIGTQYNLLGKINEALRDQKQVEEKEVSINNKIFQTFITPVLNTTNDDEKKQVTIGASILLHDITIDKQINTIKEDFTHMIVHELRAPLTAIKDSAELMMEIFDGKGRLDKNEEQKLLKIIDRQSKNLLEQINQVLDAAKIEAGRFSINKTPSDIADVIQATIDIFAPQAAKAQINLVSDIASPLPKVNFDPIRINQVLTNLVSNSLKFTHPGGKIVISAKTDKDRLVVAVSDTGMGIPEADQKDLFSKYYQIRTTPHELAKKGTGLGLYITKGIVEAHGGLVGVISSEGKGTTIYFTLPFEGGAPAVTLGHQIMPQTPKVSAMVN
jgi:signal transduction histidine kinase